MNFEDIQRRAIEIRSKYDNLNKTNRGVVWNEQQLMAGFVEDVGASFKDYYGKTWTSLYGGYR